MRAWWICGLACLSLLGAPAHGQTQEEALLGVDPLTAKPVADMAPLAWLVGCWINSRQGRMVWQPPRDGAMRASAIPPLGPGEIIMDGDGLALFRGANPGFPAVAVTDSKAVFFLRQSARAPRDGAPAFADTQGPELHGMTVSFERLADDQIVMRQSSSGADLILRGPGDRYRRCTAAEARRATQPAGRTGR